LIEDNDRPAIRLVQHFVQEQIVKRLAFQDQALVWRIARNQPRQIRRLGVFDREIARQFSVKGGYAFAGRPQLVMTPSGIEQRGLHRMAAPKPNSITVAAAPPTVPVAAFASAQQFLAAFIIPASQLI